MEINPLANDKSGLLDQPSATTVIVARYLSTTLRRSFAMSCLRDS